MRILRQPIKVIDYFFEAPTLWREFALKQEYSRENNSTWPGVRSTEINLLNMNLFNSLAGSLIQHVHDRKSFQLLKANFASVDESYNLGWIHQDEFHFNVAGVIFLNNDAPKGTGISFYNKISDIQHNFNESFFEEINCNPSDRDKFIKIKEEQRTHFRRNMIVENVFNRCVMFHPEEWHSAEKYFGKTLNDSRLTLTFFGIAI